MVSWALVFRRHPESAENVIDLRDLEIQDDTKWSFCTHRMRCAPSLKSEGPIGSERMFENDR